MTMQLDLVFAPKVSYVMYQSRMDCLLSANATNDGGPLAEVTFKLRSEPAFFREAELRADLMGAGEVMDLRANPAFKVDLDPDYISSLTVRTDSEVTLEAWKDGEVIASAASRVSVLPFDDWPGCDMPDTIASFVMPNSESLATVRASASDIMREWGKSPSLEGYQGDRDRVLTMGAAVFTALRRANINYVNPPAGFESRGQRVRIPDEVLGNHEGTCIDLAVLYASVLESIGINTLIFFVSGHAFAGFWLVDDRQSEIVSFDPSAATRLIRGKDMRAVECTMLTNSQDVSFEDACESALRRLEDADRFICSVDIRRSRPSILPLPHRRLIAGAWVVEREERDVTALAPDSVGAVYDIEETTRQLTRMDRWKRELLDITNRNNMINMKQGTKVAPLLLRDIRGFEDALADGREFTITPKPQEWDGTQTYGARPFETELYVGNYAPIAGDDLARGRIRTPMTDRDTEKSMRSIYRLANRELEESGCNSLFIALGVLRWYEGRSSGVAHYAPLIMIPASMRKRQTGFSVSKLDEDTVFNVTLLEKLRQEYEMDVPVPDPLPSDDKGVNVDHILQIVRRSIAGKEGWEVLEGAALGVFSFNQFVMWKDLDSNVDMLRENEVVRCMMDSVPYQSRSMEVDDGADPYGLCLTVPADGSQIRAVRAAGEGRTFVMHGPPGTGKSQTITNMITNALYNGKTVLFVAEKRAALEVVQKRLEEVGIGNHCLELHSNKSEKGKVLDQLRRSLEGCRAVDAGKLEEITSKIRSIQSKLDGYVSALHKERPWGLSAFDCISRYETHATERSREIQVSTSAVSAMTSESVQAMESWIRDASQAYSLVRDMDSGPMRDIGLDRAVASIGEDVDRVLSDAESAAVRLDNAKATLSGCDLPVDPEDPAGAKAVHASIMSIEPSVCRRADVSTLPEKLTAVREGVRNMAMYASTWTTMGMGVHPNTLSDALVRLDSLEPMLSPFTDSDFQGASLLKTMLSDLRTYCGTLIRLRSEVASVNAVWNPGVYELDRDWNVAAAYRAVESAGFFGKGKARKEFLSKTSGCLRNPGCKFDSIGPTAELVSRISPDIRSVIGIPNRYSSEMAREVSAAGEAVSGLSTSAAVARDLLARHDLDPSSLPALRASAEKMGPAIEELSAAGEEWRRASAAVSDLLKTSSDVSTPESFRMLRDAVSPHSGRVFDWASWNSYANRLRSSGLSAAVDLIYEGMDTDDVVDSAYRSVYKTMINLCRQDSEPLRAFSADSFEKLIEQFRSLDLTYTNFNRNLLRHRLYLNTPGNMDESSSGSEAYILYRAINSSRMRKSIRTLLSEIPNILPKVCPCLLMSPQSVAQYITPDFPKFDLVIFDESSQITTSKAVGALGRAKSAVIAGDSRQLPPTSFFQKKVESTDDDDDQVDIDSFLDDCLSLNMPETYLEWHYRSRHESLIAFSNKMFYGNKMLTFPSPNDQETKVGIRKVNGTYEKGVRCNPIEASAVVEDIRRRLMDPALCNQSIGVVAFSVNQQSCIQDALDDRVKHDTELFQRLNSMPEELFIKNLETVQGDERDVILFSIGYGPDANGVVSQNFGPINREGGGRRLNVAVSRARSEMVVFTSMGYNDVKLTPTSSKGVRSLRDFLRFAENGGRFSEVSEEARMEQASSVLRELSGFLRDNGYGTHYGIGNSAFKVDIAVVDPDNPSEYILGILNDGPSYKDSDNTRDREYAREDVLKRLGWSIMHVWSIDWYFNRSRTEKAVLETLERLREKTIPTVVEAPAIDTEYGLSEEPESDSPIASAPMAQVDSKRIPYTPYVPNPYPVNPDIAVSDRAWVNMVSVPIIEAESPVSEALLIKRFCESVGIKRLSAAKRETLTSRLREIHSPETEGGFVTYWSKDADHGIETYRVGEDDDARDIAWVPLVEILNAVKDTLDKSGSVAVDNAPVAVGRTLGYSRIGNNIRTTVAEAMEIAVQKGIVKESNGRYLLP